MKIGFAFGILPGSERFCFGFIGIAEKGEGLIGVGGDDDVVEGFRLTVAFDLNLLLLSMDGVDLCTGDEGDVVPAWTHFFDIGLAATLNGAPLGTVFDAE